MFLLIKYIAYTWFIFGHLLQARQLCDFLIASLLTSPILKKVVTLRRKGLLLGRERIDSQGGGLSFLLEKSPFREGCKIKL